MKTINQIVAIALNNLRSIPSRLSSSLVIVVGIAGVVGVLTALLSMSRGFEATLTATGRTDRALVLRSGSNAELNSALSRDSIDVIRAGAGIVRGAGGQPLAAAEMLVIAELPKRDDAGRSVNVSLRGVPPAGFEMRPELRIIEGRRFEPGLREVIVGRGAHRQFAHTDVGEMLRFRGSDWKVVGIFETNDAHDSELWADIDTTQTAFGRTGYSSVLAQLASADAIEVLETSLANDPRVSVDIENEQEYFSAQSRNFTRLIGILASVVSVIMALGAIFGALNTMYSAVAARTTEIATLRALGFGAIPVIASVLAESMLLAVIGGVLGALIAWVLFNGFSVSTLGAGFAQVTFSFQVTPRLLLNGLIIALIIGFAGGLIPALRAVRLPVTAALRAA